MILSTRNTLVGKLADKLGLTKNFNKYTEVKFDPNDNVFISPVEAKVMKVGDINSEGLLVSKNGKKIALNNFIGDYAKNFIGGKYINFYLNPGNKHFWVTPYDGKFIYTQKNEGKSWLPVFVGLENLLGIEMFSRAVKKNASIGSVYQTKDFLMAIIAIGSLNVNRIYIDYEEMQNYDKGTPCGYFAIGSSLLLCFPGYLNILVEEKSDIQIGQRIL
ncbi:MAG: phosphatidylserine decarboxylase [Melioribacteraceae bacterium]|nr:phosphatidylserine decarboxylase [Melioribacteraceae bacterium]